MAVILLRLCCIVINHMPAVQVQIYACDYYEANVICSMLRGKGSPSSIVDRNLLLVGRSSEGKESICYVLAGPCACGYYMPPAICAMMKKEKSISK
jgi:hypothetical protein